MKMSYWFVYYNVYFTNKDDTLVQIKGNSVHELASESFLPNNIIEAIRDEHLKVLKQKHLYEPELDITINSFGEIDPIGFNNFSNKTDSGVKQQIVMSGREYYSKKVQIVTDGTIHIKV